MGRMILAVIAGFVAWSIIWVGSDQVLMSIWPDWYGAHQREFEFAFQSGGEFSPDRTVLVMHIVRSVIISIMAGFLAAAISGENRRTPVILGVILFLFGCLVQVMAWNYLPLWYHMLFLALLVPMTVLGGKMKTST